MAEEKDFAEQEKMADKLLLEAVDAQDYGRINLCLQKGADINARAENGRTPLAMAVWSERPQMVEFLLSRGPDLFARDNAGRHAFDLIGEVRDTTKRAAITELLLRALPDHVRRGAKTPVEAAARAEQEGFVPTATGSDITVSKPLTPQPRKAPGGKGFSL